MGPYDPDDPAPQGVDRLIRSLEQAGVEPNSNVYAELGGTCTISSRTPNEGLIVHAILPLHDTPHQPADIKAER